MKAHNKGSIVQITAAQPYHRAAWQEGAVYPSCLDLLYQDKRKSSNNLFK